MGRDYLILADRHPADIEAALRRFAVEGRDPGLARIRCLPCSSPGLKEHIALSDIVVAWEDSLDELSLGWRPLGSIAALCREMNKPLDVVCGSCSVEAKILRKSGITNIFPLEGICGNAFPEGDELLVAGCDEAGRGCLAGPVFAAAVILPEGFYHPLLNDSKQLSATQRNMLRSSIESSALAWKVVAVDAQEIDRINILNASIEGMRRALAALGRRPHCILVDGNRFKPCCDATGRVIPHHCIVHGDARCAAISAASVLAKTHRDEYMVRLAEEFPQYGWDRNFAYPTAEHKAAIKEFGITPYHRKSYKLD